MVDWGSHTAPQISVPRQSGIRFGDRPSVGDAIANLGKAMQYKSAELKEAEDRKQHLLDSNEAHRILNETDLAVEEGVDNLRKQGLSSEDFRTQARAFTEDTYKAAETRIGETIKTDRIRSYGQQQLGSGFTRRAVAIGDEADARLMDEGRANLATNRQALVNRAINAPDDISYSLYLSQHKDLVIGQSGNLLSREKAEEALSTDLKTIAVERLKMQIRRRPDAVEDMLGKAAGQGLPENEKDGIRDYAARVRREQAAEQARLDAEAERVFKGQAEEAEIRVSELARKQQITKDEIADIALRYRGPRGEPIFTSEKVATLQKRAEDAGKFESDPATMKRLRLALAEASSESQLADIGRAIGEAYRGDKINGTDYDLLDGRTRTYTTTARDEVRKTYQQSHETAIQELKALYNIDPLGLKIDDEKSVAYEKALRELNEASAFKGGTSDPLTFLHENRIRFAGFAGQVLQNQINLLVKQTPYQTVPALRAAKDRGELSPTEYQRALRNLAEIAEMQKHQERLKSYRPTPTIPDNPRGR
jgi:hypothetical protein